MREIIQQDGEGRRAAGGREERQPAGGGEDPERQGQEVWAAGQVSLSPPISSRHNLRYVKVTRFPGSGGRRTPAAGGGVVAVGVAGVGAGEARRP